MCPSVGNEHPFNGYRYDMHAIQQCNVTLKNEALWNLFNDLQTEMIITKTGRRMFPSLELQVTGLNPQAHYCVFLQMDLAMHCRLKYSSSVGWSPAGNEEAQSPHKMYLHPESPSTGEQWMSQAFSFGRVKLTNTSSAPLGHIVLSSMHKYQPRIIFVETNNAGAYRWAPSKIFAFPETQFVAVTAYQNERITKLKIDHNPFAKGFRDNGKYSAKRKAPPPSEASGGSSPPLSPLLDVETVDSNNNDEVVPRFVPMYGYGYPPVAPMYGGFWPPMPFYYPPYYKIPSPVRAPEPQDCEPANKKPKPLTDFSIRAITGL